MGEEGEHEGDAGGEEEEEPVARAQLSFEGDYDTAIQAAGGKTQLMEEISAKISPSRCVDVESGSIIVTIEGHPDDVQASTDDMAANGLKTTNLDLGPGEIIQAPTLINIVTNADGDEDEEEESKQISVINHENASHDKKSSVGDFDLNDLSNDGS